MKALEENERHKMHTCTSKFFMLYFRATNLTSLYVQSRTELNTATAQHKEVMKIWIDLRGQDIGVAIRTFEAAQVADTSQLVQ